MKSVLALVATAGLLSPVLAAPSPLVATREGTQEVALRVIFDKSTSETSISVWNAVGSILGETCSNLLDSGNFASFPISTANLDKNGAGNITLGTESYIVHEDPKFSNGNLECSRMYNDGEALVNCKALLPASLQLTPLPNREACFSKGNGLNLERTMVSFHNAYAQGFNNSRPAAVESRSLAAVDSRSSEKRQRCDNYQTGTRIIGNGDPWQEFFKQQLSEPIDCGGLSCSVGYERTRSMTKGWDASASAAGWISGGYAVQTSWSSGNQYTCSGGPGQRICIWYSFAHTAYNVQNWSKNVCYGDQYGPGFRMRSPNQNNRGGSFYCVVGTCRSITDNYWEDGRAGGPA